MKRNPQVIAFMTAFPYSIDVDAPLEDCMQRDPKGLYTKAKAGKLKNFTGVDAPYEAPDDPEIHLQTIGQSAEELADVVICALGERNIVDGFAS